MRCAGSERVFVYFSFILILLLCAPVWYKLTRITRTPIAFEEILQLTNESSQILSYPLTIHLKFIDFTSSSTFSKIVQDELAASIQAKVGNYYSVQFEFIRPSTNIPELEILTENQIDNLLHQYLNKSSNIFHYSLFLLDPTPNDNFELKYSVGKYRHGWTSSLDSLQQLAEVFIFGIEDKSLDNLKVVLPPKSRVSFNLLNTVPPTRAALSLQQLSIILKHQEFIHFFNQLRQLNYKISYETQIINFPDPAQLANLNPNDFNTNFLSPAEKLLQFLVVIKPTQTQTNTPNKNDSANSTITFGKEFLIPGTGGIVEVITNNPTEISLQDMKLAFKILFLHLRNLLGLSNHFPKEGRFPAFSNRFLFEWEKDFLIKKNAKKNFGISVNNLQSITTLIQKQKNMIVKQHIKERIDKVVRCVTDLGVAFKENADRQVDVIYADSLECLEISEATFFDESMASTLYYPDEHEAAIYIPHFVPVAWPIALGLLYEFWRWLRVWLWRGLLYLYSKISPNKKIDT
eukprot:TRINITY_DN4047_c0_g1_i1.p1 TRINITY_DN4047_c0_g1~~TRINITY_DN4047_c0_g1_i1.p1  ORF type:complete len:518 (-),score=57.46 TRINITY_DN4047_c0_g1_i1:9-1562(-)